ncbi:MAG TPA: acyl-CoA dehydratase activase-related protein [Candidatus Gastranaerophilales bacterium]|nr:acyl-CoA dehydratase activase-related protein [Candidatus Gastranaerophilales bacterium]
MTNKKSKKIKVSFPHMGSLYVVGASLIKSLGGEVILPPKTSKKTLSLGTKYSPEAICLPYKLLLGNYIEAVERGAEAVIMISSPGICRLGEYSKSIKNALEDLGYKIKYIDIDLYKGKFFELVDCMKTVSGNTNIVDLGKAVGLALQKVFVLDDLENTLSYYRAREFDYGQAEKAFNKSLNWVDEASTGKDLKEAKIEAIKEIKKTAIDTNREVLNVDLTGEIFMVLDPFSNQHIERELGRLGVQTKRSMSLSGWVKTAIIPKFLRSGETHLERAFRFAKPYLTRDIGGDAIESVSDVAYATSRGTDGIVHVSPFTCMPEIMSQNIFPRMRQDGALPILALVMDEQTGRAGFVTRLEAFVDLMKRRKRLSNAGMA